MDKKLEDKLPEEPRRRSLAEHYHLIYGCSLMGREEMYAQEKREEEKERKEKEALDYQI